MNTLRSKGTAYTAAGFLLLLMSCFSYALPPGIHAWQPDNVDVDESASCRDCHSADDTDVGAWMERGPHHLNTVDDFLESDGFQSVIRDLGMTEDATYSQGSVCASCHLSVTPDEGDYDGLTCQKCHGAGAQWLDDHQDGFGFQAAHDAGKIPKGDYFSMAQQCYSCHLMANETVINGSNNHKKPNMPGMEMDFYKRAQEPFVTHGGIDFQADKKKIQLSGEAAQLVAILYELSQIKEPKGQLAKSLLDLYGKSYARLVKANKLSGAPSLTAVIPVIPEPGSLKPGDKSLESVSQQLYMQAFEALNGYKAPMQYQGAIQDPDPVVQKDPDPVVHKDPDPVVHKDPDPVVHKDPDPVDHEDPDPVVHEDPAPVVHKDPDPVGLPVDSLVLNNEELTFIKHFSLVAPIVDSRCSAGEFVWAEPWVSVDYLLSVNKLVSCYSVLANVEKGHSIAMVKKTSQGYFNLSEPSCMGGLEKSEGKAVLLPMSNGISTVVEQTVSPADEYILFAVSSAQAQAFSAELSKLGNACDQNAQTSTEVQQAFIQFVSQHKADIDWQTFKAKP